MFTYFTWHDMSYRQFMHNILRRLEPCQYPKYWTMLNELDECGEITFIQKGRIFVGFEMNRQKKFVLKLEDKCVIAAFNVTFGQRSRFIYKV